MRTVYVLSPTGPSICDAEGRCFSLLTMSDQVRTWLNITRGVRTKAELGARLCRAEAYKVCTRIPRGLCTALHDLTRRSTPLGVLSILPQLVRRGTSVIKITTDLPTHPLSACWPIGHIQRQHRDPASQRDFNSRSSGSPGTDTTLLVVIKADRLAQSPLEYGFRVFREDVVGTAASFTVRCYGANHTYICQRKERALGGIDCS